MRTMINDNWYDCYYYYVCGSDYDDDDDDENYDGEIPQKATFDSTYEHFTSCLRVLPIQRDSNVTS